MASDGTWMGRVSAVASVVSVAVAGLAAWSAYQAAQQTAQIETVGQTLQVYQNHSQAVFTSMAAASAAVVTITDPTAQTASRIEQCVRLDHLLRAHHAQFDALRGNRALSADPNIVQLANSLGPFVCDLIREEDVTVDCMVKLDGSMVFVAEAPAAETDAISPLPYACDRPASDRGPIDAAGATDGLQPLVDPQDGSSERNGVASPGPHFAVIASYRIEPDECRYAEDTFAWYAQALPAALRAAAPALAGALLAGTVRLGIYGSDGNFVAVAVDLGDSGHLARLTVDVVRGLSAGMVADTGADSYHHYTTAWRPSDRCDRLMTLQAGDGPAPPPTPEDGLQ